MMDDTSFIVCSQANFAELVQRTGLRKSVGAAKKGRGKHIPAGSVNNESNARRCSEAPETSCTNSDHASSVGRDCRNDESFVRDRFDSAWGLTMQERPSWVGKEQPWHHFQSGEAIANCCTVEAGAQTDCVPKEGAQHKEDCFDDAQLFELRRVAHRAEAERAEARMAQTKAHKCATAAQNECKDAQAKVQALESQLFEKSEKLAECEAQIHRMESAASQQDNRLQAAQSKSHALKRKVSQLQVRLKNHEQLESEHGHAKQTIQRLDDELRSLKKRFLTEMNNKAKPNPEIHSICVKNTLQPDQLGGSEPPALCSASHAPSSEYPIKAVHGEEHDPSSDHLLDDDARHDDRGTEVTLQCCMSSQSSTDTQSCAAAPELSCRAHDADAEACTLASNSRMQLSGVHYLDRESPMSGNLCYDSVSHKDDGAPQIVASPRLEDESAQSMRESQTCIGLLAGVDQESQTEDDLADAFRRAQKYEAGCVNSSCQCDLLEVQVYVPGNDSESSAVDHDIDNCKFHTHTHHAQVASGHAQGPPQHGAVDSSPCTPAQSSSLRSSTPSAQSPCLQVSHDTLKQVEDILQDISSIHRKDSPASGSGDVEHIPESNTGNLALAAYLSHLTASIASILTARGTSNASSAQGRPVFWRPVSQHFSAHDSNGVGDALKTSRWVNARTCSNGGRPLITSSTSGICLTRPPSGPGHSTGPSSSGGVNSGSDQRPFSGYYQSPGQSVSAAVHCLSAMNDRLAHENQQLLEEAAQKHADSILQDHQTRRITSTTEPLQQLLASSDCLHVSGIDYVDVGKGSVDWQAMPAILGCGTWQKLLEGMLHTLKTIRFTCTSIMEPSHLVLGHMLDYDDLKHTPAQGETARSQHAANVTPDLTGLGEQERFQSQSDLQGMTDEEDPQQQHGQTCSPDDRVILAIAKVAMHFLNYTRQLQSQLLERSAEGIQYAESQAALQSQIQDFQAELQAMHKRVQVAERQGKRSFAGLKTKQECMTGHTSDSGPEGSQPSTSGSRDIVEDSRNSSIAPTRPRSASAGRSGAPAELNAQIQRLNVALGACTRDKAKHEAVLKKRAEDAETAAAESAIALQRSVARSKELQRQLEQKDALLAAAGFSENASGAAALRACQVREHQREVLSLNKEIGSLQAQLREAQRAAAKAKEQGTWKFISAAKEASAATKTASETRKDAEESLLNMAAHLEEKERRIHVLSQLVRVAEDQTTDAIQLASVLKEQRDSEALAGPTLARY